MCSVTSPWAKIAFKGSALGTNRDRVQYHTIKQRLIDVQVVGSLNFFGQGSTSSSFYRASVVLAKLQVWALAGAFVVVHFYQIFTAYPAGPFTFPLSFSSPFDLSNSKKMLGEIQNGGMHFPWHCTKSQGENLAIAFFLTSFTKKRFCFQISTVQSLIGGLAMHCSSQMLAFCLCFPTIFQGKAWLSEGSIQLCPNHFPGSSPVNHSSALDWCWCTVACRLRGVHHPVHASVAADCSDQVRTARLSQVCAPFFTP